MTLKFPNYTDSLTVEECFNILEKNEMTLDISVIPNPTSPSFEIKQVDIDVGKSKGLARWNR